MIQAPGQTLKHLSCRDCKTIQVSSLCHEPFATTELQLRKQSLSFSALVLSFALSPIISLSFLASSTNFKGKTWGPSTGNQRSRNVLPDLSKTSTSSTEISKSAPNLNKTLTLFTGKSHVVLDNSNIAGGSVDLLDHFEENDEASLPSLDPKFDYFNRASSFKLSTAIPSAEVSYFNNHHQSPMRVHEKSSTPIITNLFSCSKSSDDLSSFGRSRSPFYSPNNDNKRDVPKKKTSICSRVFSEDRTASTTTNNSSETLCDLNCNESGNHFRIDDSQVLFNASNVTYTSTRSASKPWKFEFFKKLTPKVALRSKSPKSKKFGKLKDARDEFLVGTNNKKFHSALDIERRGNDTKNTRDS